MNKLTKFVSEHIDTIADIVLVADTFGAIAIAGAALHKLKKTQRFNNLFKQAMILSMDGDTVGFLVKPKRSGIKNTTFKVTVKAVSGRFKWNA